jgi:plastocyanin
MTDDIGSPDLSSRRRVLQILGTGGLAAGVGFGAASSDRVADLIGTGNSGPEEPPAEETQQRPAGDTQSTDTPADASQSEESQSDATQSEQTVYEWNGPLLGPTGATRAEVSVDSFDRPLVVTETGSAFGAPDGTFTIVDSYSGWSETDDRQTLGTYSFEAFPGGDPDQLTATGEGPVVQFTFGDDEVFELADQTLQYRLTPKESVQIDPAADDRLDATGEEVVFEQTIGLVTDPGISLKTTDDEVRTGEFVSFEAEPTVANKTDSVDEFQFDEYQWHIERSGEQESFSGRLQQVAFQEPGEYDVWVGAMHPSMGSSVAQREGGSYPDDIGTYNIASETTIVVSETPKPTITVDPAKDVYEPGESITFTASETPGLSEEYRWAFDTGARESGQSVSKTFEETGTIQIKLKVTADTGKSTITERRIYIEEEFDPFQEED